MESKRSIEENFDINYEQHAVSILQQLNNDRETGFQCDFTIKVGSEELKVHKNVLSASSNYFKAMLSHENVETLSSSVQIREVDPICVKRCIDFIYTGRAKVEDENRESLIYVANMMQLQRLCDAIAFSYEKSLNSESFFDIKRIADTYNCKNLEKTCKLFASQHFKEIARFEEFVELDEKFISFLIESENTKANNDVKCKMLLIWTKYDIGSRKDFFLHLGTKIDFDKMNLSYRRFLVENEPILYESFEILRLLTLSVFNCSNIIPKDTKLIERGILIVDKFSRKMLCYDINDKTYTTLKIANNSVIQDGYSAVVMDSFVCVICNNGLFYRFNYGDVHAKWEQLPTSYFQHSLAVVLDGYIYCIESESYSNIFTRFDPANNEWTILPNKWLAIKNETLTSYEGKVICIAGYSEYDGALGLVEVYDPNTSMWHMDDVLLNLPRYYASATSTEEGIYVMGGYSNYGYAPINDVEFRSDVTKIWTMLKPMKHARQHFSSCSIDAKIYVIGGNEYFGNIEEYNPDMREWNVVETLQDKQIIPLMCATISLKG